MTCALAPLYQIPMDCSGMLLAEAEGDGDDDDVVEEEAEQETPAKKPKKVFKPPPLSR